MEKAACHMPDRTPVTDEIKDLLRNAKRIAILGLSPKATRDSNRVARYLLEHGYEIVPVHPAQTEILGVPCYKRIEDIPFPVDIANLFLNPARIPPIVDQAIEAHIPVIWMQLGIVHDDAAQRARRSGIQVIMNRCIMRDHMALG